MKLVFLLLIDICFTSLYCRKINLYLCLLTIRFGIVLTMYLLFGGSIYYGIWYMKTTSYQWILVSGVLSVLTYILLYRCTCFRKLSEYCYKVKIEFESYKVCCYGYWDSGNFANKDAVPIIFLHDSRIGLCKTIDTQLLNQTISVVLGSVSGIHIPKQKVYIAYIDHEIEHMYPCLLNQLLER